MPLMSRFILLPFLKNAFLFLFLLICCYCCFSIMRNENAEPKTQHPEEQRETSNYIAQDKKEALPSEHGNMNVNPSVIKCGSCDEKAVLKESGAPLSQKLRKEPLTESREGKINYESAEIEPQSDMLTSPINDGFIAIFFFALLRLDRFNEILSLISKYRPDEFISTLIMMGNNMGNIYSILPSFLETLRKSLEKKFFLDPLPLYNRVTYFYRHLGYYFIDRSYLDTKTASCFFYMLFKVNHGFMGYELDNSSEENTVDHEISSIIESKKYEDDSNIKLLDAPNILLFIPDKVIFSLQSLPFNDILIDGNTYHPKSFILKTMNSSYQEYFTCLLRNDNETWILLDEKGCNLGDRQNAGFQYETEICGVFYEQ